MSRSKPIGETLSGKVGHVPAELLMDSRIKGREVKLYALIRSFGPGRDTWRSKAELAAAINWSEAKIHRAADRLLEAGWLTRTDAKRAGSHVSIWKVSGSSTNPEQLAKVRATDSQKCEITSRKSESHRLAKVSEEGDSQNCAKRTTNHQKNHPRDREGLSSSISKRKTLSVHELWGCLPSWDRDHAPEGWEALADSLVDVLDRNALPKGTTQATLALAFVDRIRSRKSLRGINSGEGILIKAARGRCDSDDVLALQELLGRAPTPKHSEPDLFGTESIPIELLADLADSLAPPDTRRPLRARSRA